MPVTADDLEEAAAAYAGELHRLTGDGVLDAVHLGLGPDGHTASWPPGDPVAASSTGRTSPSSGRSTAGCG